MPLHLSVNVGSTGWGGKVAGNLAILVAIMSVKASFQLTQLKERVVYKSDLQISFQIDFLALFLIFRGPAR